MDYKRRKDRNQVFMTTLEEMVPQESWSRVVDVFVDAMPIEDFGFTNSQ